MSDYENKVFGLLKGINDEYEGMSRKEMQDSEKRVPDLFDDWEAMNPQLVADAYANARWDFQRTKCADPWQRMHEILHDAYNQYVEGF